VTLRRALAPEGDTLWVQGRPIHVAAWAKRFLFRPEQLEVPVGRLSGGEQARVLIARLMHDPADLLVLDEPTNDLDIPALEVLEESLADFPGGLLLVTHDRFLLDRVSTLIVALDGQGGTETFADYNQWEESRRQRLSPSRPPRPDADAARPRPRPKRLTYHEQREWEGMEQAILAAEAATAAAQQAADDPTIATDAAALQARHAALDATRAEVARLYSRWADLEAKQA
jgi:ABC transport system ATP-binding/permease protein